MKLTLPERLSASLYEPEGDLYEYRSLMPFMVATMMIGTPMMLGWAFVFLYFFSETGAFLGFAGYALFNLALLALMSIRRMRATRVRDVYLGVHLAANFLIVASLGGIAKSTGVILFALIAPFSMVTQPRRQFLGWLIATMALAVLVVALQPFLRSSNNVPHLWSTIFWGVNLVNFTVILYWNLRALLHQRDTALEMLRVEQLKSENLLLNILPSEIAQVLKNENRTIADHIEQASV